jgi:superfamily II DNA or RNA helicase
MGGGNRKLFIVVPTTNLQEQWRDEAAKLYGIQLATAELGNAFAKGFVGGVTTYQGLSSLVEKVFRKCCGHNDTMVILDEVHHCGDEASWGGIVKRSFDGASRLLLLSGTPFRTDGTPIPFVQYDGLGVCLPDYRYDYPHALQDGIIRSLAFEYAKGRFEELNAVGEVETHEVHFGITEEEAASRLRMLLNASGRYVEESLRQAHEKLMEIRRVIPDAGGIVACIDQVHAVAIADVLERVTGCQPAVIVSDSEKSTSSVKQFRDSRREWVVAVRQVSEGTDIKRLHVLVYFTNITTDVFFRQLIGRVCRVRFTKQGEASEDAFSYDAGASVFLPADPRLMEHAKNIEEAQMRALLQKEKDREREPGPGPEPISRTFLGSSHDGVEAIIIGGRAYSSEAVEHIKAMSSSGGITIEKAAAFYDMGFGRRGTHEETKEQTHEDPPLEEVMRKKRRIANGLAFSLSKLLQVHVQEIHREFAPRQESMNEEQLDSKIANLRKRIEATKWQ